MEDWAAAARDVEQAIEDVGFDVLLSQPGVKSGPASSPSIGAPTNITVKVIQRDVRVRDFSGTLTGQTTRTFTMKATGIVPTKKDKIILASGRSYDILNVMTISPGGVDLLHRMDTEA